MLYTRMFYDWFQFCLLTTGLFNVIWECLQWKAGALSWCRHLEHPTVWASNLDSTFSLNCVLSHCHFVWMKSLDSTLIVDHPFKLFLFMCSLYFCCWCWCIRLIATITVVNFQSFHSLLYIISNKQKVTIHACFVLLLNHFVPILLSLKSPLLCYPIFPYVSSYT